MRQVERLVSSALFTLFDWVLIVPGYRDHVVPFHSPEGTPGEWMTNPFTGNQTFSGTPSVVILQKGHADYHLCRARFPSALLGHLAMDPWRQCFHRGARDVRLSHWPKLNLLRSPPITPLSCTRSLTLPRTRALTDCDPLSLFLEKWLAAKGFDFKIQAIK